MSSKKTSLGVCISELSLESNPLLVDYSQAFPSYNINNYINPLKLKSFFMR